MIAELVTMHRLIGEMYAELIDFEDACKGEIEVIRIDVQKAMYHGTVKKGQTIEQIMANQALKYTLALDRADKLKTALKELDKSVGGGL